MGFGKLLEEKMKAKGIKQAELAEAVGLPQTTLSSMILRDNTKIEIEKFLKICDYLDCNPDDFYAEFKSAAPKMTPLFSSKYHSLDSFGKKMVNAVLDMEYERCQTAIETEKSRIIQKKIARLSASAGTGDYLDNDDFERISLIRTPEAEAADFAVRINGDSMDPTYHDDDILLVESTPQINKGDIGVFVVNGDGFVKEFGGDRLISHNSRYPDVILHTYDTVFCSGRVIGTAEKAKRNIK